MVRKFLARMLGADKEVEELRSQLQAAATDCLRLSSENRQLRSLVTALRDVNASLDRRLVDGGL